MEIFDTVLPASDPSETDLVLTLDHQQRRRARLRIMLPNGHAVGLALPRGIALKDGDRLRAGSGRIARVRAAAEHVSIAETADLELLARAAYHLGNRHVALRVERGRLLYLHDHVLDGMCRELGLTLSTELLPFEPELGGYGAGHAHVHVHANDRAPHDHGR